MRLEMAADTRQLKAHCCVMFRAVGRKEKGMGFCGVGFLFGFLPFTLAGYYGIPRRFRRGRSLFLLGMSLLWYAYAAPGSIGLLLLSAALYYLSGAALGACRENKGARRAVLAVSAALSLTLLIGSRYGALFPARVSAFLGGSAGAPPLGVSFYTLCGMSYVFDVYFRAVPVQKNPLKLTLFLSLFAKLPAGPVTGYKAIAGLPDAGRETLRGFAAGIRRFIFGLGKTLLLARPMREVADAVFGQDPARLGGGIAWLGAVAYAFFILFVFSGYSDMAIGLGGMFGFSLPENFDHPYASRSVTEFWQRWHMSLVGWFRRYVYLPLGGRRGGARGLFLLPAVWLLIGLWHGIGWSFALWGLYFSAILIGEKLFLGKLLRRLPSFLPRVYTLLLVLFGWVLFRSADPRSAGLYFSAMFRFSSDGADGALYLLAQNKAAFLACLACSVPLVPYAKRSLEKIRPGRPREWLRSLPAALFALAVFGISILALVATGFDPLEFFRF